MKLETSKEEAPVAAGLWTIQDVSAFLVVPVGTLYQWRHRGARRRCAWAGTCASSPRP